MPIADPADLLPFFDVRETDVSLTTTASQLVPADPQRVTLLIGNISTGAIYLSTRDRGIVAGGFPVLAVGATPFHLQYSRDGALVTWQWWAQSVDPVATVTVIEVLYRPRRGQEVANA